MAFVSCDVDSDVETGYPMAIYPTSASPFEVDTQHMYYLEDDEEVAFSITLNGYTSYFIVTNAESFDFTDMTPGNSYYISGTDTLVYTIAMDENFTLCYPYYTLELTSIGLTTDYPPHHNKPTTSQYTC